MGLLDRCVEKMERNRMERLTVEFLGQAAPGKLCTFDECGKVIDCDNCAGSDGNCDGICDECPVQECFEKLAEYEDTGLAPEQIREMDRLYRAKCEEVSKYKKALEEMKENNKIERC